MIKFYNTKMLSPNVLDVPDVPGSDPVMPGKGTYAYDKMGIEYAKSLLPTDPSNSFVTQATENVITYFESDHPVETEEPDAEKQIIYNHDYILQVDPSETALVRESKEMLDAAIRSSVAQSIEPPEESYDPGTGPVVEPVTDPDDPGTGQNA